MLILPTELPIGEQMKVQPLQTLIGRALYGNVPKYIAHVRSVQRNGQVCLDEPWDVEEMRRMAAAITRHATEDDLDLYAQGRLLNGETGALEEHLLACQQCRDELDLVAPFARAMKKHGWAWRLPVGLV